MGKVVQLRLDARQPRLVPLTSESFQRAWAAFPEAGRHRSSRSEAWPIWSQIAAEIGEAQLEAAVLAYARKPNDGEPGFHRWLTWGRWDAWLQTPTEPTPKKPPRFIGEAIRAAFHARFADERARDWFDRCYRADGLNTFVGSRAEPKPRQEWIDGPFSAWMRANGLSWFRWGEG